ADACPPSLAETNPGAEIPSPPDSRPACVEKPTVLAVHPAPPRTHQHLHPLAACRSPYSKTDSVQKQIRPVIVQPGLMKLLHRLVQMLRDPRYRLRAHPSLR